MENPVTMNGFLSGTRQNVIAKHLIPMEMGMGWPILSIRNKKLCVTVPFYQAVVHSDDQTLLFPIAYTMAVLWPNGVIVEYKNLRFDSKYQDIDFSKPVGTFRHDTIKHLNKSQYIEKRNELYKLYDELITCLFSHEPLAEDSEKKFKETLGLLMEPSLKPFYQAIDIQFYNRLIK